MNRVARILTFALVLAPGEAPADDSLRTQALSFFGHLAPTTRPPAQEVTLGRMLFWDERLSLDGKTSCASCHLADSWGADPRPASVDAKGKPTSRHSPTVFNSMAQPTLRWLGDRNSGADQAEGSMTGSMGFDSKQAGLKKLGELGYATYFKAAYPSDTEPMTPVNYGKALAAYQATLVTPSPFDRYLAGDPTALSEKQVAGLKAFVETGCTACHNGPLLGGLSYQRFGLVKEYWKETGSKKIDDGRFSITKNDQDKYVFRVPMLRNVAKTGPYFHDGSVAKLQDAVRIMASVQLGRQLDEPTVASITTFLESLTGEVPAHYSRPQALRVEMAGERAK